MCISSNEFGILFIEVKINIINLNTWSSFKKNLNKWYAKKTNYILQDVISLMWGVCVESSTLNFVSFEHTFISRDNLLPYKMFV